MRQVSYSKPSGSFPRDQEYTNESWFWLDRKPSYIKISHNIHFAMRVQLFPSPFKNGHLSALTVCVFGMLEKGKQLKTTKQMALHSASSPGHFSVIRFCTECVYWAYKYILKMWPYTASNLVSPPDAKTMHVLHYFQNILTI